MMSKRARLFTVFATLGMSIALTAMVFSIIKLVLTMEHTHWITWPLIVLLCAVTCVMWFLDASALWSKLKKKAQ